MRPYDRYWVGRWVCGGQLGFSYLYASSLNPHHSSLITRCVTAVRQIGLTRKICDPLRHAFLEEAEVALEDERDDDLAQAIVDAVDVRLLPVVTLGQSRTDLAHKYSCLIHTITLEAGDLRESYLDAVIGCCSDQGRSSHH